MNLVEEYTEFCLGRIRFMDLSGSAVVERTASARGWLLRHPALSMPDQRLIFLIATAD